MKHVVRVWVSNSNGPWDEYDFLGTVEQACRAAMSKAKEELKYEVADRRKCWVSKAEVVATLAS